MNLKTILTTAALGAFLGALPVAAFAHDPSAHQNDNANVTSGSDSAYERPAGFGTMDRDLATGQVPKDVSVGNTYYGDSAKTVERTRTTRTDWTNESRETASTNPNTPVVLTAQAGRDFEVLTFDTGSATLTDSAKNRLRTLLDNARSMGKIDHIHAVVWSDESYPAIKGDELSKAQRNLASDRIRNIKSFMKGDLKARGLDTYNMAERSNWFARAFNTKDAELKSMFAEQGAPLSVTPAELRIARERGGPERAVIIVQMSDRASGSL